MAAKLTRADIRAIVRTWQRRLEIDHWSIEIDFGTPAEASEEGREGPWASIWRSRDYDLARLCLAEGWCDWSRREANEHVVHELVHLWTREVEFVLDALYRVDIHGDARSVIEETHRHLTEGVVDRIARRLIALVGPA